MRHDPLYTSWLVRCGSEDQARRIRQGLEAFPVASLTFQDAVRAFPGGSELRQDRPHVVGDYFAAVRILPEPSPSSFQLLFERKPGAPQQWKDVMMSVLRMVRDGGADMAPTPVDITLTYRGDVYPPPAAP